MCCDYNAVLVCSLLDSSLTMISDISFRAHVHTVLAFWGAEGAPILFSDLGLRMASCSYIQCKLQYTPLI